LEARREEETLRVGSQAQTVVVGRIAELISLFQLLKIPKADGQVTAQGDHIVAIGMVNDLLHVFSMRTDDSSIVVIGQIQNREHSSRSATCHLGSVLGKR
jgi:hypothetical protein